jgi:PAS domain S-box-containing protein
METVMVDHMVQNTNQYDILIVDDTRDSLELLNRILEERGYRVRPASSGRLALKSVAAKLPDLILLDLKMPEMDGFEVCRRLKLDEYSRKVPVIFISAFGDTAKKVEGFKVGAVDFITKPFEAEEVMARVATHLQLNELTERLEQKVAERTEALHGANAKLEHELAERKQAEAALRQSETLLNATQRLAKIGGWGWDVERQISFWTEETYRIHGLTPQSFAPGSTGHIDRSLVCYRADDRQTILEAFERCVQEGDGYDLEFPFTAADGIRKWIRTTATAIREHGRIVKIVGTIMDITQRKRVEDELARYRNHLEELVLTRTEELDAANKEMHAFTYTVSHDLRAPLRHIDGFLELLQRKAGTAPNEESRHYIDAISSAAKKMGLLIDDLLAFSRMGRHALSFERVPLGALLRDVIREFAPDAAGRTIDWRIGDLPEVGGDASMLRMVLSNLLANALKFTRPREKARIEIGSLAGQDAETVIFVRDNGVGFDMTYADKLFGVFQRLHHEEEFEGTGIGLANVRRIIARHRGRTWAEGAPDKGAIFYFSLPHIP